MSDNVKVTDAGKRHNRIKLLEIAGRRGLLLAGTRLQHAMVREHEKIRPDAIATGATYRSYTVSPVRVGSDGKGKYLYVRIGPRTKHALWGVETGRRPGKPPPLKAIIAWVREKPGGSSLTEDHVRAIAWRIRSRIATKGTKGYKIISKSVAKERGNSIKILRFSAIAALKFGR